MTLRVVVADDQSMVRAGFRSLLNEEPDLEVVGEAADGEQAVAAVRRLKPDVTLMDIRMPNVDGLEATRRIAAAGLATRVLILTTFDLDEYVYEGLRGALDTLTAREREVLRLLARGRSNAEVARELVVSEATAKTHVRHVLAKLDLRDRVQAVVFAYESGLVRAGDA